MVWEQAARHLHNLAKMSPKDVIENHIQCFRDGDIIRILSNYSDDAILLTPDGVFKGRESIENFIRKLLKEFHRPGASRTVRKAVFEGNYAYVMWSAETPDDIYEFASDTFVIRQGRILMQSSVARIVSKQLPLISSEVLEPIG